MSRTRQTGVLERRALVTKLWKNRFYKLEGATLLCYAREPQTTSARPRRTLQVLGVTSVPHRPGTRQHRFDAFCAPPGDSSEEPFVLSLNASSDEEKRSWMGALAAVSRLAPLVDHPRLKDFMVSDARATRDALRGEEQALKGTFPLDDLVQSAIPQKNATSRNLSTSQLSGLRNCDRTSSVVLVQKHVRGMLCRSRMLYLAMHVGCPMEVVVVKCQGLPVQTGTERENMQTTSSNSNSGSSNAYKAAHASEIGVMLTLVHKPGPSHDPQQRFCFQLPPAQLRSDGSLNLGTPVFVPGVEAKGMHICVTLFNKSDRFNFMGQAVLRVDSSTRMWRDGCELALKLDRMRFHPLRKPLSLGVFKHNLRNIDRVCDGSVTLKLLPQNRSQSMCGFLQHRVVHGSEAHQVVHNRNRKIGEANVDFKKQDATENSHTIPRHMDMAMPPHDWHPEIPRARGWLVRRSQEEWTKRWVVLAPDGLRIYPNYGITSPVCMLPAHTLTNITCMETPEDDDMEDNMLHHVPEIEVRIPRNADGAYDVHQFHLERTVGSRRSQRHQRDAWKWKLHDFVCPKAKNGGFPHAISLQLLNVNDFVGVLGPKVDVELQVAVGAVKMRAPLLRANDDADGVSESSTEVTLDLSSTTQGERNLVVKLKRKKRTLACARLPLATLSWSADEPVVHVDACAELASESRSAETSSSHMKLRIVFAYVQVPGSEQVLGGQTQRVRYLMGKKGAVADALHNYRQ